MLENTQFFATCPKGLEALLHQELVELGANDLRETVAGVYFTADLGTAYRVCLWSRLANKVLLPLASLAVETADDLYRLVRELPWEAHIRPEGTLLVDFSGQNQTIRNTQFGALRVKDAIVDRLRDVCGQRPSVSRDNPDLRINVRLARGKAAVSLDLCGDSLHRRGYRKQQGEAPLKENLAAAILLRSGWLEEDFSALLDPMCGSGTFLIEAAFMKADIAPGLYRSSFAFERWLNHQSDIWLPLRQEALARREAGLAREDLPEIRGYDANLRVIRAAEDNIVRAGLDDWLRVTRKELNVFTRPTHTNLERGLVVTNPPYGERLGDIESMKLLYAHMGERLRQDFAGWRVGVFTGNPELGRKMALRAYKKYKLFNGTIPSELLLLELSGDNLIRLQPRTPAEEPQAAPASALPEGAQMLVNRLQKNLKQLKRWRQREQVNSYRLYDADMPEYAAAIDLYYGHKLTDESPVLQVHVQEYAPPRSVDPDKAAERLMHIERALPVALDVSAENISVKQRRRNRGTSQYEKLTEKPTGELLVVQEGQARLLINLWQYMDTGLFLDHRPLRAKIAQQARGKRFLNLFCYTATASVQAALGGARFTLSVDMSTTYLGWASQNLALNGLSESRNRLEQADCMQWLQNAEQTFDMILLDPPSFSNSKRMDNVLDVQRDHVWMIDRAMRLLADDGVLFFSNNLRSFTLDKEALAAFDLKDITTQTIDSDFSRNPRIHQCWEIRHQGNA